jgi:hypothetical protein
MAAPLSEYYPAPSSVVAPDFTAPAEASDVLPVIVPYSGIGNAELKGRTTAAMNMGRMMAHLEDARFAVTKPIIPKFLGVIRSVQGHLADALEEEQELLSPYGPSVYPIRIGHSLGGVVAAGAHVEDIRRKRDSGLVTISSPLKGCRENPFNRLIPGPLQFIDRYSSRADDIERFSRKNIDFLSQRHNENVAMVGTSFDWAGQPHSSLPALPGAKRLAVTQTGRPIKGLEDVPTVRIPGIEHITSPSRSEIIDFVAARALEMVRRQRLAQAAGNVIVGNFDAAR